MYGHVNWILLVQDSFLWGAIANTAVKLRIRFWMFVPCIWFEIRINNQLDAIEYLFTLARHFSGLYAHLHEQWML
jgi:hypothetical protein